LLRGYDNHAYVFRANEWTTGDGGRISASNITYDENRNVIKAKATGANNIALTLKYNETDYTIDKAQKYLIVRGTNLKTTTDASYLWWLNGVNKGSSVKPYTQRNVSIGNDTQTLIAWNMATSGLYDNFTGNRPSICIGQTIFGLTASSTNGACEIHDINFAESIDAYLAAANIGALLPDSSDPEQSGKVYDLLGRPTDHPQGIYIQNNQKYYQSTR
jgi:hypothetical protein